MITGGFTPLLANRPTTAVTGAVLGGALVTTLSWYWLVAPHSTLAGFLGLVCVAMSATALLRLAFVGPAGPAAVTFHAFLLVWSALASLLQIRDGRLPWPDSPLDNLYPVTQLVPILALVAYHVGYNRFHVGVAAAGDERPAVPPSPRRLVNHQTAAIATLIALVVGAYSIRATGGLAAMFTSRWELDDTFAADGLYNRPDEGGGAGQTLLGLFHIFPQAASLAALAVCLQSFRGGRYRRPSMGQMTLLLSTVISIGLNVIFNNFLTASRFTFFSVLLVIALSVFQLRRKLVRAVFTVGLPTGLALVYPLADYFRSDTAKSGPLRIGKEAYFSVDFDGLQQSVNTMDYVNHHGHTWGYHLISALFFWIPRSLWSDKALPASLPIAENRGYSFQALSLPLWSESYLEFSWIGVALCFLLYGLLGRQIDTVWRDQGGSLGALLATVFAAAQIGLLRGPLGSQIPFAGAAIVVVVVAHLSTGVVGAIRPAVAARMATWSRAGHRRPAFGSRQ